MLCSWFVNVGHRVLKFSHLADRILTQTVFDAIIDHQWTFHISDLGIPFRIDNQQFHHDFLTNVNFCLGQLSVVQVVGP